MEKSEGENDKYADVEFAKEKSNEKGNFVLHRVLLTSKDEDQRKNLFKTRCFIQNKVSNLIVDNESSENLVLQKLVDYLMLPIETHDMPYTLVR